MRLDEISRRGFLRGAGALAASAALPADVKGFISDFSKDIGGQKNLELLVELLKQFDISDLNQFLEYANGELSFSEVLNDEESSRLADRLVSSSIVDIDDPDYNFDDNTDIINYWIQNVKFDGDIYNAASKLIGYPIDYARMVEILNKNGTDQYEFYDFNNGLGEVISDAYMKSIEKYQNSNITADNLLQMAKSAGLPANISRLASMISFVIKKFIGSTENLPVPVQQKSEPNSTQKLPALPALPAPSDNDLGDLSNIERMKDLAGIQRK